MDIVLIFVYIAVAFTLAFLVEAMVEYLFGTPFDKVPALTPYKWTLMYVALLVGVGLALYYKIDLVAVIAQVIARMVDPESGFAFPLTPVGMVLSGLAIGRGSNFLHDWLSKSMQKPELPIGGPA